MHRFDRRTFLAWLATLPVLRRARNGSTQQPFIEVRPTALFQQPDGRKNLVRITVSGLGAPAARARVTDRRGALRGPATPATHAAETVDALLAGVDSYRRRLHGHPGERPRGPSQESRRGARVDVDPSRLSLHRRMRVAGAVVRGESLARGGRRAAPGDPRWEGRLAGAVRQHAHGLARSRNIRAAGVAGRQARPRARCRCCRRVAGAKAPRIRSSTTGKVPTAAASCTGGRTTTATARALALTSVRTKWATGCPAGCSISRHSWPRTGRTTPRCCMAPIGRTTR